MDKKENCTNEYVLTFSCSNSADHVAYESIQELYKFWKDAYDVESGITIESADTEEELLYVITSKYSIFEEVRD